MRNRNVDVAIAIAIAVAVWVVGGSAGASAGRTGEGTWVSPPKHVQAAPGEGSVRLSWENWGENYDGTLVLRSATGFAVTPTDTAASPVTVFYGLGTQVTDTGLLDGTDYFYTLFNHDAGLVYSQPVTLTVFPGAPTHICAWAEAGCVYFGQEATFWAHLKRDATAAPSPPRFGACEWGSEEGTAIPGRQDVTLYKSHDHGQTWTPDGTATWDSVVGLYAASRRLTANTKFQFRFAGDRSGAPVLAACQSGWVWVECKAGVKQPYPPPVVRKGQGFNVTGRYLHRPAGRVRLYFFRYSGGRWVRYRYVYARNVLNTRYLLGYRLPYRGKWFVKGCYRDANHAPTWTSRRYMYVR